MINFCFIIFFFFSDLNPSTSSLAQMSFVVSILTYFYILYDRVWAQFGLVDLALWSLLV